MNFTDLVRLLLGSGLIPHSFLGGYGCPLTTLRISTLTNHLSFGSRFILMLHHCERDIGGRRFLGQLA